jgi:hypothetical protein
VWDWDGWNDKPWVPVTASRPSSDEERGYHEAEKPGQMHPRSHECQHNVIREVQLRTWILGWKLVTQAKSYDPSILWRLARSTASDDLGMTYHLTSSTMLLESYRGAIEGTRRKVPYGRNFRVLQPSSTRIVYEVTRCRLGSLRKKVICRLGSGPTFNVPGFSGP